MSLASWVINLGPIEARLRVLTDEHLQRIQPGGKTSFQSQLGTNIFKLKQIQEILCFESTREFNTPCQVRGRRQ